MDIDSNHVRIQGDFTFHWNEIMSNLNEFNELLGTDFTSVSTRETIENESAKVIAKSFMEKDGKIEISKLAPYITKTSEQ